MRSRSPLFFAAAAAMAVVASGAAEPVAFIAPPRRRREPPLDGDDVIRTSRTAYERQAREPSPFDQERLRRAAQKRARKAALALQHLGGLS